MLKALLKKIQSNLNPDAALSLKFWFGLILSSGLWASLVMIRPYVIETRCETKPEICNPSQLPDYERIAVRNIDYQWGTRSDITQNLSGILAFLGPAALHASFVLGKSAIPSIAAIAYFKDFVIALQAVAWTGAATEATKLITQRPRPYVYAAPKHHKHMQAYSTYTSFYSGHTSFAAAAGMVHFLTLAVRAAHPIWLASSFILYLGLMIFTGLARVLSGVHFPTDVIVGAFMGSVISAFVFFIIRKR